MYRERLECVEDACLLRWKNTGEGDRGEMYRSGFVGVVEVVRVDLDSCAHRLLHFWRHSLTVLFRNPVKTTWESCVAL